MRRKNLLKELGIQKQADTSCNALDIDTENIRQRVYAKLDFADTERKQTTMRSKKKNITFVDSCNTYNWSYCCGGNREDFNVDRFICITC